jgi:hypothetical protein
VEENVTKALSFSMEFPGLQSPTPNLYVDNQDGSGDIIQITQPPSNSSVPTSPLTTHPLLSHHQQQQRPISFNNAKASTIDPNWQANKISIRERNAAMFNNELMADIFFVVGPPGKNLLSLTLTCQHFPSKLPTFSPFYHANRWDANYSCP